MLFSFNPSPLRITFWMQIPRKLDGVEVVLSNLSVIIFLRTFPHLMEPVTHATRRRKNDGVSTSRKSRLSRYPQVIGFIKGELLHRQPVSAVVSALQLQLEFDHGAQRQPFDHGPGLQFRRYAARQCDGHRQRAEWSRIADADRNADANGDPGGDSHCVGNGDNHPESDPDALGHAAGDHLYAG